MKPTITFLFLSMLTQGVNAHSTINQQKEAIKQSSTTGAKALPSGSMMVTDGRLKGKKLLLSLTELSKLVQPNLPMGSIVESGGITANGEKVSLALQVTGSGKSKTTSRLTIPLTILNDGFIALTQSGTLTTAANGKETRSTVTIGKPTGSNYVGHVTLLR